MFDDDERRVQPQWSLAVEKTRFKVLKLISEGGHIHWENCVQHLELVSWFAPHSTVCRVRGAPETKKKKNGNV
jgi:hypothetical protein